MPNRVLKDQNYRFGFNGKEADREGQWGSTEHYDYGFRIYDPKIARFLSVDPLTSSYPWYTPYQFAGNKPIAAIDLDGLEEWFTYNSFTNSVSRAKLRPGQRGLLNLDETNEMGLYSSDQIHHMVFDKSYATALNASLEARREKAIARRNFEEHKAKMSNPFTYAPMIAEELAEAPMLGAYAIKGTLTGDYTDFKYQAVGLLIPGASKTVISTFSKDIKSAHRYGKQYNRISKSQSPNRIYKQGDQLPNELSGVMDDLDGRNVALYEYQIQDANGGLVEKVFIRHDKAAKYGDGGQGDQAEHFNVYRKDSNGNYVDTKQHHYVEKD